MECQELIHTQGEDICFFYVCVEMGAGCWILSALIHFKEQQIHISHKHHNLKLWIRYGSSAALHCNFLCLFLEIQSTSIYCTCPLGKGIKTFFKVRGEMEIAAGLPFLELWTMKLRHCRAMWGLEKEVRTLQDAITQDLIILQHHEQQCNVEWL